MTRKKIEPEPSSEVTEESDSEDIYNPYNRLRRE
jgi:hypothetical protein